VCRVYVTNKHRPALPDICGLWNRTRSPGKAVALDALASIGGHDARVVISGLLDDRVVQGPTLKVAVRFAAALRCRLSAVTVLPLLRRHADPEVRAIACGLAGPRVDINADRFPHPLARSVASDDRKPNVIEADDS
jgi:hypothetical protein